MVFIEDWFGKILRLCIFIVFMGFQAYSACDYPKSLQSSNLSNNSIDLNWDAVVGAIDYTLNYRIVGKNGWVSVSQSSTSAVLNCLFSGSDYEWKVKANCNSGTSEFAPVKTFTTTGTVPTSLNLCNIPSGLQSSGMSDTGVSLSWTAVAGAIDYQVNYRPLGMANWNKAIATGSQITLSGLYSGSTYQWKVQTRCEVDNSCNNTRASLFAKTETFVTTGATASIPTCNYPDNLAASNVTANSADLGWDVVAGIGNYHIVYRTVGAVKWTQFWPTTNQISVTSLQAGTSYQWKVRVFCSNGMVSLFAPTKTFTTPGTPLCYAPLNLKLNSKTETCADLSWDISENVLSYTFKYREYGTTTWTSSNTSSNGIVISGLIPSTTYEWRIQSDCGSGMSPESQSAFFSTHGSTAPSCFVPADNHVTSNITSNSADLSWDDSPNALYYQVQYKRRNQANWTTLISCSNDWELTGLVANRNYQWRVRAVCSIDGTNVSAYSSINNFRTLASCDTPSNLRYTEIFSFILLRWNRVNSALSYNMQIRVQGSTTWFDFTSNNNWIWLSGAQSGTTYEWRVQSVCSADGNWTSIYSAIETFTFGGGGFFFGRSAAASAATTNSAFSQYSGQNSAASLIGLTENEPGSFKTASNTANPIPNPTTESFSIPMESSRMDYTISVFSSSGDLVYQRWYAAGSPNQISLSGLTKGVYLVKTTSSTETVTSKLILN